MAHYTSDPKLLVDEVINTVFIEDVVQIAFEYANEIVGQCSSRKISDRVDSLVTHYKREVEPMLLEACGNKLISRYATNTFFSATLVHIASRHRSLYAGSDKKSKNNQMVPLLGGAVEIVKKES